MQNAELEKAFNILTQALTITESELNEEINLIHKQIEQLKQRIIELNSHQQSLTHDKQSLLDMCSRYKDSVSSAAKF